jgi:hypothetical protein
MDRLLLNVVTADAVRADKPLEAIHAKWKPGLEDFATRREKFLIYK